MRKVRHCYNVTCECNYDGAYCEAAEISIGSDGMCCTYAPKPDLKEESLGGTHDHPDQLPRQ